MRIIGFPVLHARYHGRDNVIVQHPMLLEEDEVCSRREERERLELGDLWNFWMCSRGEEETWPPQD